MHTRLLMLFALLFSGFTYGIAQQVPDSSFQFPIPKPAYLPGKGPVITLDEAHYNFHTLGDRYYAFGKTLERDGYVLRSGRQPFSLATLQGTRILVIANALADTGDWVLPAKPAFTREEIVALTAWVQEGGSLFLIADHMPFPGVAADLAAAFGFNFINGFAMRPDGKAEIFSRSNGRLKSSPVIEGRNKQEGIDSVRVFTGQGFIPPKGATVLTELDANYVILLPAVAWEFNDKTPSMSGIGLANGACLDFGKGRVVVFGEAAMFSAQLAGPNRQKMGMNHPGAPQNPQFLLNIIHWLDRKI